MSNIKDLNDLGAFGDALLQARRLDACVAMVEQEIYTGNVKTDRDKLALLAMLLADAKDLVESIGTALDAIKD